MYNGWDGDGIIIKPFKKHIEVEHQTEFAKGCSFVNEFFHLTGEKDEKGFLKFDMTLNIKQGRFNVSLYDKSVALNPKYIKYIQFVD